MKFKNIYIQKIDSKIIPLNASVHISDCIIEQLDLIGLELKHEVVIERCIIKEMKIHSCWFVGGLSLTNSIILSDVDYQMGGHNEKQILLDGNIFKGFFSFFDCHFEEQLIITNNAFMGNSDLLLSEGKGFDNTYEKGYVVKDNTGRLDTMGCF